MLDLLPLLLTPMPSLCIQKDIRISGYQEHSSCCSSFFHPVDPLIIDSSPFPGAVSFSVLPLRLLILDLETSRKKWIIRDPKKKKKKKTRNVFSSLEKAIESFCLIGYYLSNFHFMDLLSFLPCVSGEFQGKTIMIL